MRFTSINRNLLQDFSATVNHISFIKPIIAIGSFLAFIACAMNGLSYMR